MSELVTGKTDHMTIAYFRSLAARFFHRSRTEKELEEEIRSHIQLRADDLERSGLSCVLKRNVARGSSSAVRSNLGRNVAKRSPEISSTTSCRMCGSA